MLPGETIAPAESRRHVHRSVTALLLATALLIGSGAAGQIPGLTSPDAAAPKQLPVPDPANLKTNWWDYVAPAEPGLQDRITALLQRAGEAAAVLPDELAGDAGQSLDRLRVGLTALPAMLEARPPARAVLPPLADSYTTRQALDLDRQARALQTELDERRTALNFSARTAKAGQRQLDTLVTEYLGAETTGTQRTALGLRLMAQRVQLAVADADQRNRSAEKAVIEAELAALRDIAALAMTRIVPDPERTPEEMAALIEKNRAKAAEQRERVLELEAERTTAAANPATTLTELELADQRILAAVVEEAYLTSRISLYETELDWLAVVAGGLESDTVLGIQEKVIARISDIERIEADGREWLRAAGKALTLSLRGTEESLPPEELRTRADLTRIAQQTISRIDRLQGRLADLRFGTTVTRQLLAESSGWRDWLWLRVLHPATTFFAAADAALGATLFRLGETPVTSYGLLRILLILVIAAALSRLVRRLLARVGSRKGAESAAYYTVGRLAHYVLILVALIIGLSSIGLDFTQLALFAGALSIGIGFGLQSVVNNFVSGLTILFERNLKIGDVVELDSGVRGVVKEISVRTTLISTNDGVDIVVPNSEFISGKVTNYTLHEPTYRIHVPFGVAYGSDKELVRRVVVESAHKVPMTLQMPGRDPDVWLVRFGDNSLDFELVVWINLAAVTRAGAVTATYLWEIETALSAAGIQIPFPQRDVRVKLEPGALTSLVGAPAAGNPP